MEKEAVPSRPFNHAGFTAYLAEHKLMGSRCAQCGQIYLPPRELCPSCYVTNMEWAEFSGDGVLEGYTAIHVGLPDMVSAGYSRERPYCTGVVRLAEGPAISGLIVAGAGDCPEKITVGMPLKATYLELSPDQPVILAFATRTDRTESREKE